MSDTEEQQVEQREGDQQEAQPQESQEAVEPQAASEDPPAQEEKDSGAPPEPEQAQGDAGEEGEGETAEVEDVKEKEKISITHEDNPNWLSAEECRARGIAEENVSAFQHTFFQYSYTIKTWYETLSEHSFTTEFVSLSTDEIDVLLAASRVSEEPQLSDQQKEVLEQIEKRLNEAIEKFEGDGGFIRVNDRNPNDSILERNDAEFVAKIRDSVINELEVEKQSANAYLIWREQERTEGAFRRGMTRLRQSFRRQRPASATPKKDTPQLEETTGEKEEKKDEEGGTVEQTTEGGAEGEGQREGEGEGDKTQEDATVTVEAEVQGDDDTKQERAEPVAQTEAEQREEQQEESTTATEPEQSPQQQQPPPQQEDAPKTEDEEEIQPAPAVQQETESPKRKKEDHLQIRKVKSELLDNEILRAFGRAMTKMYKAASGKEALDMLLRSGVTKQYLQQLKSFGQVEGLSAIISISRFHADIARYPGMVFRGFVHEGELTALSQKHDDITYFPSVFQYKNIIQSKVQQFYTSHVKEALADRGSYIIDLFVSTDKVYILRLSPFYTGIGACLFTWTEDAQTLTQGPLEFKIIETCSRKAPDLYSGLQPQWNSMLDSVLQQKQGEHRNRTCTIL